MTAASHLTALPPVVHKHDPSTLSILDRGVESYLTTLALQEQLVEERRAGRIPDTLILVEHPAVFTLGRSAHSTDFLTPPEELAAMGLPVIPTTRGGQITYHGPGQIVMYPIIELKATNEGPAWYVGNLEQVIIRTLAAFGVTAVGDAKNRGVWVGTDKIAAIGVRITRRITLHGAALNVRVDLAPYQHIIPCGIRDRGVTSLHRLCGEIELDKVKRQIVQEFMTVFDRVPAT